jgi:hypothetical protein
MHVYRVASTCQPISRNLREPGRDSAASAGAAGVSLAASSRDYDVPVTGPDSDAVSATSAAEGATGEDVADDGGRAFLESLMDTELYSMGAFFCDEHPDLVDEVVERSTAIEDRGLEAYASEAGVSVEESFGTLLTGLAVRYYKAVAG